MADLLMCWPDNCDYPLFRQFLVENRHRLGRVLVTITPTNSHTVKYAEFVKHELFDQSIEFYQLQSNHGGDWRDVAVNMMLDQLPDDSRVWFIEQDFIVQNEAFWQYIGDNADSPVIGVYQADRLHPCCLIADKLIINETKRDFAANPPHHDHFGQFQKDLNKLSIPITVIPWELYYHYNGLSHNFRLITEGKPPVYNPELFYAYLEATINVGVKLHDEYKKAVYRALGR